ncbi:MAG: NfeD family protein [Actinomycetes bacterium]
MRHRRRLATILLGVACLVAGTAGTAGASGRGARTEAAVSSGRGGIIVVQVKGLLDPPNARLITSAIEDANRARASVVVLDIDSDGAVDLDLEPVLAAIRSSRVPVTTWVGPAGSEAKGAAAVIAAASAVLGVGSGSHIGPAHPEARDTTEPARSAVAARLARLSERNGRDAAAARDLVAARLDARTVTASGAADRICGRPANGDGCATLGDFVVRIDGRVVTTARGEVRLDTSKVIGQGQDRRRQPNQPVAFRKLTLAGQAEHTLTNPSIAYALLIIGLALIVFEFFTISIGLAGGAGALAVIGACVGFSHLPVTWWGIALLGLSAFAFAVDVQVGRPAVWSGIGTVALITGSLFLYTGSSSLAVPWWLVIVMVASALLFYLGGMPIAVRSRFSTPTVGRESLIGELGEAAVAIDPDGVVLIDGARWRARTNRATPIPAGAQIRVVEVLGLVLEVEPEEGGAKDYREMRRGRVGDPEGDTTG